MLPMKTSAIQNFLQAKARSDLAGMYSYSMEVQVNVAQDNGEQVEGDYKGRKWLGWTDGLTTWKPFRIPYKANTEPEYTDIPMKFDLAEHAEAIGMTGWDWTNKVSKWVAFDFDNIINHAAGLTTIELQEMLTSVESIEWVTVRRSTSGQGYHFYVFLPEVPTQNHVEHAALARAILGQLSAITGINFTTKVDACGGNMWIWHRKMTQQGLQLLKKGTILTQIPDNWREHQDVIIGKRRKVSPQIIEEKDVDLFDQLAGQCNITPLEDGHKELFDFLREKEALWWWDADHHMLVTHTYWLKIAHTDMSLLGVFETNTEAKNPNEQNCFCFPMRGGAWQVRRFTQGVQEAKTWQQDGQGWTRCYYNRTADFTTACRTFGGLKDPKGSYVFPEASTALEALALLGVHPKVSNRLQCRKTKVKMNQDSTEVIIELDKEPNDPSHEMEQWLNEGNKPWTLCEKLPRRSLYEPETGNYDDVIRHLVAGNDHKDAGWTMNCNNKWQEEPKGNIKDYLKSLGYKSNEADIIIGAQISKPWKIVTKHFQPEFPGDREWNRKSAQLKYLPTIDKDELSHPHWDMILRRIGSGLDDAVDADVWCKLNGLHKGADYLKCWIASLFQEPDEPLPYLFLFGPQNNGKSTFYEAIKLLLINGVMDASSAMENSSAYNKELELAILCYIDEKDLQNSKQAYNRIKEWVTAKEILIHEKYVTPYTAPNTTHWVQCANDSKFCPIFPGDTRITMIYVDYLSPEEMIPKKVFFRNLEKEAPDFIASLLATELPESNDRLNIPIVGTSEKFSAQELNKTDLERFFDEHCVYAPGYSLLFSEFYDNFIEWIEPTEAHKWGKINVGKSIPAPYIKGRAHGTAHFHIGNCIWKGDEFENRHKFGIINGYLEPLREGGTHA